MAPRKLLLIVFLCLIPMSAQAQDALPQSPDVQEVQLFRQMPAHAKAVIKAINEIRSSQQLDLKERLALRKLEWAMHVPSFQKRAEDMTILQMAFSDTNDLETGPDGAILRGNINWDGLLAFLKEFIPILLQLLERFGI